MAIIQRNGVDGKKCSTCDIWKSLNEYYRDASKGPTQGGRHCRCKICYTERRKQRVDLKREKSK